MPVPKLSKIAHRIAVLIDNRDVDRIAVQRHLEVRQVGQGMTKIDHLGQAFREVVREQFRHRHVRLGGIGNPGIACRIGKPRRLDFQMQPIRRARRMARVEMGENVEDEKGDDPLAVRWALMDHVIAE